MTKINAWALIDKKTNKISGTTTSRASARASAKVMKKQMKKEYLVRACIITIK